MVMAVMEGMGKGLPLIELERQTRRKIQIQPKVVNTQKNADTGRWKNDNTNGCGE
jgi:hypothetical protein